MQRSDYTTYLVNRLKLQKCVSTSVECEFDVYVCFVNGSMKLLSASLNEYWRYTVLKFLSSCVINLFNKYVLRCNVP